MNIYKKIVVAIDFNAEYENVVQRAIAVCQSTEDVNLVYVCMPIVYLQPLLYGGEYDVTTDSENLSNAKESLEEIAQKFGINKENVYVKLGDVSDEIKCLANDCKADLIVIGTHGRSGIKMLLGSTANAVLHGVKQDVLAVRMHDN
ncbi:universal stress protein [Brumicola pallidula]|jgi:universal stress protein A|uniref:Universal stress protein n=1 Tax=Brumicola pallidula DSM 14239 = ACAM 615 TaxID=1121922 RepID=K6ZXY8_9ALTE|nr:universal stress protein [Glaciecola pallidula]GAC28180.1 universal stress protein A homolog 1 [Glaciecola pallidula DSM 14239 = ACAM 615]